MSKNFKEIDIYNVLHLPISSEHGWLGENDDYNYHFEDTNSENFDDLDKASDFLLNHMSFEEREIGVGEIVQGNTSMNDSEYVDGGENVRISESLNVSVVAK